MQLQECREAKYPLNQNGYDNMGIYLKNVKYYSTSIKSPTHLCPDHKVCLSQCQAGIMCFH